MRAVSLPRATTPGITPRSRRGVFLILTLVLLSLAAVELGIGLVGPSNWRVAIGMDLDFYAQAAARLFSGGDWYVDRQLHGPYQIVPFVDVLYPPAAAWIFAPFIVLPVGVLLALAIGTIAWLIRDWRPAPWTWPLMALCLLWPLTLLKSISGNSSLLVMMALGLGLRFGWPSAMILLKPSFLPMALIGVRTRGWWITAGVLAIASLPFLADTLRYPQVILDSRSADGVLYSLNDLPTMLIPAIAWAGRQRRSASEGHP
jgi:hypothetical protein